VRGYVVLVWAGRHVSEMSELDEEEIRAYCMGEVSVVRSLQRIYRPMKMNVLILGNKTPHLHSHIIPRHATDPAPEEPIPWSKMFQKEEIPQLTLLRQRDVLCRELGVVQ
jgi:diadenosine tetraphosphate (Ap4A) HIT family hydrolase